MKRQVVHTSAPTEVSESYARAVAVGDWIFVSNSSGKNYDTQELPTSVADQTNGVLDNIARALAALGSSLDDVVRRVVVIPRADDAPEVMAIVGERFRDTEAANTVLCSPLGVAAFRVEIEVTAYRGIASAETETINI
ncbi:Rid family hydrolase [Streptomyces chartreusis]|uniref:Rid family hydrolase n=1 Tax=Streptomyces chartreusis TaxID=1969 RepID=UPI0036605B62